MFFFSRIFFFVIKTAVVLAINFVLFMIIPMSHFLFGMFDETKKDPAPQQRIVAELVRPPKEEQKEQPKSALRTVSTSSSPALQDPMQFRFNPDLSVAAGGDGVAIRTEQLQAEVYEEGDVDVNAIPVNVKAPPYPQRARDLAIEGVVIVQFVVREDGKVGAIENITAPHPLFSAEFRTAMEQWRFTPARKNGIPVRQRLRLPVEYVLDR